jgi:hypothetical protein
MRLTRELLIQLVGERTFWHWQHGPDGLAKRTSNFTPTEVVFRGMTAAHPISDDGSESVDGLGPPQTTMVVRDHERRIDLCDFIDDAELMDRLSDQERAALDSMEPWQASSHLTRLRYEAAKEDALILIDFINAIAGAGYAEGYVNANEGAQNHSGAPRYAKVPWIERDEYETWDQYHRRFHDGHDQSQASQKVQADDFRKVFDDRVRSLLGDVTDQSPVTRKQLAEIIGVKLNSSIVGSMLPRPDEPSKGRNPAVWSWGNVKDHAWAKALQQHFMSLGDDRHKASYVSRRIVADEAPPDAEINSVST